MHAELGPEFLRVSDFTFDPKFVIPAGQDHRDVDLLALSQGLAGNALAIDEQIKLSSAKQLKLVRSQNTYRGV